MNDVVVIRKNISTEEQFKHFCDGVDTEGWMAQPANRAPTLKEMQVAVSGDWYVSGMRNPSLKQIQSAGLKWPIMVEYFPDSISLMLETLSESIL